MINENTGKKDSCSIMVYSCARNCSMWQIFLTLFRKYWRACPYNLILLTDRLPEEPEKYEYKKYHFDKVVEYDETWGRMILNGIKSVGTNYVMLFMDDYLLCQNVKTEDIMNLIDKADKYSAATVLLIRDGFSKREEFTEDSELGKIEQGSAYSLSTQPAIWNTQFLMDHIDPNWSAWDFERVGSLNIRDAKKPFLYTTKYYFPYEEGVRNGKWLDVGMRVCRRNGIEPNLKEHKAMTNMELAKIYFKGAVLSFNPGLILKIQKKLCRKTTMKSQH